MQVPTPVTPPSPQQLVRIDELRDEIFNRIKDGRQALNEAYDKLTNLDRTSEIGTSDRANEVELSLLRFLVDSTRPNPFHLSK